MPAARARRATAGTRTLLPVEGITVSTTAGFLVVAGAFVVPSSIAVVLPPSMGVSSARVVPAVVGAAVVASVEGAAVVASVEGAAAVASVEGAAVASGAFVVVVVGSIQPLPIFPPPGAVSEGAVVSAKADTANVHTAIAAKITARSKETVFFILITIL